MEGTRKKCYAFSYGLPLSLERRCELVMYVPPIKQGSRMSREEAIRVLLQEGFNQLEAEVYLQSDDAHARQIVLDGMRERRRGKGPAPV
jgi:hypothetical protein